MSFPSCASHLQSQLVVTKIGRRRDGREGCPRQDYKTVAPPAVPILYKAVLEVVLPWLDEIVRARQPFGNYSATAA